MLLDRETNALVLAIEIDGLHHRYHRSYVPWKNHQKMDEEKEKICRESGGGVLKSLDKTKADVHFASAPQFTLLRLATDGASRSEFLDDAGDGSADRLYTIEELYDKQWAISKKNPLTIDIGRSVTTLINSSDGWKRSSKETNELLERSEWIKKDREEVVVDGLPKTLKMYWRATEKGLDAGICNRLGIRKSKEEGGYWYPLFPEEIETYVREPNGREEEEDA